MAILAYFIYCETQFAGKDFHYRRSAQIPRVQTLDVINVFKKKVMNFTFSGPRALHDNLSNFNHWWISQAWEAGYKDYSPNETSVSYSGCSWLFQTGKEHDIKSKFWLSPPKVKLWKWKCGFPFCHSVSFVQKISHFAIKIDPVSDPVSDLKISQIFWVIKF